MNCISLQQSLSNASPSIIPCTQLSPINLQSQFSGWTIKGTFPPSNKLIASPTSVEAGTRHKYPFRVLPILLYDVCSRKAPNSPNHFHVACMYPRKQTWRPNLLTLARPQPDPPRTLSRTDAFQWPGCRAGSGSNMPGPDGHGQLGGVPPTRKAILEKN